MKAMLILIFMLILTMFGFENNLGKGTLQAGSDERMLKNKDQESVDKLIKEMTEHSKRINDYFANAVRVYAILGEEKAHVAALAAAKVAAKKQRESMAKYLYGMASDVLESFPKDSSRKRIAMRLLSLKEEIEEKDWNLEDIREEKARLFKIDPEYCRSLDQANPNVFVRRYPKLFKE